MVMSCLPLALETAGSKEMSPILLYTVVVDGVRDGEDVVVSCQDKLRNARTAERSLPLSCPRWEER